MLSLRVLASAVILVLASPAIGRAQDGAVEEDPQDWSSEDVELPDGFDDHGEPPWPATRCEAALSHADAEQRDRALNDLRHHPAEAIALLDRLIAMLRSDPDDDVRLRAAYLLGAIGPQAAPAVPALVDVALGGERYVAAAANHTLAAMCEPAAVPLLVQALDARDPPRRQRALFTLARLCPLLSPEVIGRIVAMADDREPDVRRAALAALERLQVGERALDAAVEGLRDPDGCVRGTAASLLGAVGGPRATQALLDAWAGELGASLRVAVLMALQRIGSPATLPALVEAVALEGEEDLRELALDALGALGPEAAPAVPALRARIEAADVDPSTTEWEVLATIGLPAAETLAAWVGHGDRDVRVAAALELARLGAPAASAALAALDAALARERFPEAREALTHARASLAGEANPEEAAHEIERLQRAGEDDLVEPGPAGAGPREAGLPLRPGHAKVFRLDVHARNLLTEPLVSDWAALQDELERCAGIGHEARRRLAIRRAWRNHWAPELGDPERAARLRLLDLSLEQLEAHFGEPLFVGDLLDTGADRCAIVGVRETPEGRAVRRIVEPFTLTEEALVVPSYLRYPDGIPALDFWEADRVEGFAVDHAYALKHLDEHGQLTLGEHVMSLGEEEVAALKGGEKVRQLYVFPHLGVAQLLDPADVDRSPPLGE